MLTLLSLAVQLQVGSAVLVPTDARPVQRPVVSADDSLRDVARAHDAQAGFERGRRYVLPWGAGSGGHCDVRVGRYCWWYEESATIPAEPQEVTRRREELLAELDDLARRLPQDPWLAGMRVYYRIDNRQPALAADVAGECAAEGWWCTALRAWASLASGDAAGADSAFAAALAAMPDSTRCAWRDIAPLLPGDARARYERLACADRAALEARYWALAIPRFGAGTNEWHAEFLARRTAATLLASALSPHRLPWGPDAEELLLRYGWPVAWSRIPPPSMSVLEPEILGHDPAPSFAFGPREALLDSSVTRTGFGDDGWDLRDVRAASRYASPAIRRLAPVAAQVVTFPRGDSTLVAVRWATTDDSLAHPRAVAAAVSADGAIHLASDSSANGHARVVVAGVPLVAGVELSDSASGTLARTRRVLPAPPKPRRLSGLLLFTPADDHPLSLDEALALALPGDDAPTRTIGLYWESSAADSAAELDVGVIVERIDSGLFRSFSQRLGLADPDSPLRVRWSEPSAPREGVTARSLSLDLAAMPAGRYRIAVSVGPARGTPAEASAEVQLH